MQVMAQGNLLAGYSDQSCIIVRKLPDHFMRTRQCVMIGNAYKVKRSAFRGGNDILRRHETIGVSAMNMRISLHYLVHKVLLSTPGAGLYNACDEINQQNNKKNDIQCVWYDNRLEKNDGGNPNENDIAKGFDLIKNLHTNYPLNNFVLSYADSTSTVNIE